MIPYLNTFNRLSGPLYKSGVLDRQALHHAAEELDLVLSMRMADLQELRGKLDSGLDGGSIMRTVADCLSKVLSPMMTFASRGNLSALGFTSAQRVAQDHASLAMGPINRVELKQALSEAEQLLRPLAGTGGLAASVNAVLSDASDAPIQAKVSSILGQLCAVLALVAAAASLPHVALALQQASPLGGPVVSF